MDFNVDGKIFDEIGKKLDERIEVFDLGMENIKWEMGLPSFEVKMIRKAKRDYKIKELGVSLEDFNRYIEIANTSRSLEDFYEQHNLEETKRQIKAGLINEQDLRFDVNLSIDEAYSKYSTEDKETAKKISKLLYDLDKKADLYEKEVREHYTGDLASQLGYDKEEFLAQDRKVDYENNQNKEESGAIKK